MKTMKKPLVYAQWISWVGTIGTIILAIFPFIMELFGGPKSYYDTNVAILSATLITIIWYTYWTHKSVVNPSIEAQMKSEETKKAIATALITELQWIDKIIRDMYKGGIYYYTPLNPLLIKNVSNNLHYFSDNTIKLIASFQNRVYDLNEMYINLISRSKIKEGEGEIENLSFIKLKSVLACDTLNLLVDSLLEEGGSMPDAIKFTDNSCGFPPLPERKFDEPIRL